MYLILNTFKKYMIHIALVEDDKHYVETMSGYLKQYEKDREEKIRITVFTDGEDIVCNYKADFDIILMDIEMTFMNGMTAAEKIRKVDNEVVIIFITNMPQYAIKGYTVNALDYVLKPVSYFALSQRIDRAVSRMRRHLKKYITISIKGGAMKIDTSKISYIEVQNHDLIFHTMEGNFTAKSSLRNVEISLDNQTFFRCNNCYLINLEYVDRIQNNDIFIGNDVIKVSRARKKEFLDVLNNYMNEVTK